MIRNEKFLNWDNPGTAFITGASSGIGLSFAKQLARQGFNLILLARRKDRLKTIASELESQNSIRCEIVQTDLSEIGNIKKTADYIRQINDLDVLVNNAGFATLGYFADVPIEKSLGMLNVHLTATIQLEFGVRIWGQIKNTSDSSRRRNNRHAQVRRWLDSYRYCLF